MYYGFLLYWSDCNLPATAGTTSKAIAPPMPFAPSSAIHEMGWGGDALPRGTSQAIGHIQTPERVALEIPAVVLAEDWLGRRPRLIRATYRAGLVPESRRALCWHRPPVLLPRGATRAKLCKCRQGRTPQNFDRVLAETCLC